MRATARSPPPAPLGGSARPAAVLPSQGRDIVDVVVGVPHRHPPDRLSSPRFASPSWCTYSAATTANCSSVKRRSRRSPLHGPFAAATTRWCTGLVAGLTVAKVSGAFRTGRECSGVPPAVRRPPWLVSREVAVPGGEQPRGGVVGGQAVLACPALPRQVAQQSADVPAARQYRPDHRQTRTARHGLTRWPGAPG